MAKNALLEKNKELIGVIASLNNIVHELKAQNEELRNEIEAITEEFDVTLSEVEDAHNSELANYKKQINELTSEKEKLKEALESAKANKSTSAFIGAPDVAEQLTLMGQPKAKMDTFFGVKTVSTSERLDRSKLPPKPSKPEFDTEYALYTDGACLGNGKPGLGYGGWGYVILDHSDLSGVPVEACGNAGPNSTNQIMELTAALEGIRELSITAPEDATVTLCSDSQYVINGITKWSLNWRANGWTNSKGDAVANKELWEELLNAIESSGLSIEFKWVKGHDSNHYNSVCDLLATSAAATKAQECGCHEFDENIPEY